MRSKNGCQMEIYHSRTHGDNYEDTKPQVVNVINKRDAANGVNDLKSVRSLHVSCNVYRHIKYTDSTIHETPTQ